MTTAASASSEPSGGRSPDPQSAAATATATGPDGDPAEAASSADTTTTTSGSAPGGSPSGQRGSAAPEGADGGAAGERSGSEPWHGRLWLRFAPTAGGTVHQGGSTSPLRLQRGFRRAGGRCELPILHTAGGLVGGDQLSLEVTLAAGSSALLTSVAAQKVYGTVGRSRRDPAGQWARQTLRVQVAAGGDLEWLPQELVLYANGLYSQRMRVELEPGASWLGAEVVRLGRTAAGEGLEGGRWRSALEVVRRHPEALRWELVDRLELGEQALSQEHGMAGQPVFGSLVWAAPGPLEADDLEELQRTARRSRADLEGEMVCGGLEQGLVARYRGPSTGAARTWFTRIWAAIRRQRRLPPPELPRCWPFQEQPLLVPPHVSAD